MRFQLSDSGVDIDMDELPFSLWDSYIAYGNPSATKSIAVLFMRFFLNFRQGR